MKEVVNMKRIKLFNRYQHISITLHVLEAICFKYVVMQQFFGFQLKSKVKTWEEKSEAMIETLAKSKQLLVDKVNET